MQYQRKNLQFFFEFDKVLLSKNTHSANKMNYLAFDIEAANGYKAYSICSIGIVIANEKFEIVSRQNIWINPKTSYNLNGTRKNVGIDLHLDKQLLDSSPDFSQAYSLISGYLTDSNYIIFGHAVDSDVRMLNAACNKYKLPCIEFDFIDSQLLYKLYKGDKDVHGLDKIAADIGVEFQQHNSEDDAYATMRTLQYLVEDSKLSVDELLDKYHVRKGKNRNFEITRTVTLDGQVSKRRLTQVAVDKIKSYAQKVKVTSRKYDGLVFCLARSFELSDSETLYAVVKAIVEHGGRYVSKLAKCNVYVQNAVSTDQDVMRERRVEELHSQGLVQVVSIDKIISNTL